MKPEHRKLLLSILTPHDLSRYEDEPGDTTLSEDVADLLEGWGPTPDVLPDGGSILVLRFPRRVPLGTVHGVAQAVAKIERESGRERPVLVLGDETLEAITADQMAMLGYAPTRNDTFATSLHEYTDEGLRDVWHRISDCVERLQGLGCVRAVKQLQERLHEVHQHRQAMSMKPETDHSAGETT